MQPSSLQYFSQAVIVRTLVCRPTDCKERRFLLETLKTNEGNSLSEDILLLVTELFPKELTDELLYVLAPLHLKHLKLNDCSALSCDGVVKTIIKCEHLTYLDFSRCDNLLHPALFYCLKANASCMTHLSFEDCEVMTDDAVQIILMCCPRLEHLNISSCKNITDKAFAMSSSTSNSKAASNLSQHVLLAGKRLSSVDLSGCRSLSSAAIKHLVALCGPTLTTVNISWTGVGCTALLYLAGLTHEAAVQFVRTVDSTCVGLLTSITEDEEASPSIHDLDQENQKSSVEISEKDSDSFCLAKKGTEERNCIQRDSKKPDEYTTDDKDHPSKNAKNITDEYSTDDKDHLSKNSKNTTDEYSADDKDHPSKNAKNITDGDEFRMRNSHSSGNSCFYYAEITDYDTRSEYGKKYSNVHESPTGMDQRLVNLKENIPDDYNKRETKATGSYQDSRDESTRVDTEFCPNVDLPEASTIVINSYGQPQLRKGPSLEEEWRLAWQQVGEEDSCSDNDELFDSVWSDVQCQPLHVDSVSSAFGDAISCLSYALLNLKSTDDDDDDVGDASGRVADGTVTDIHDTNDDGCVDDDGISGEGSDCKAIAIHDSHDDGISGEGSDCKAIAIHDSDDDGISGEGSDCKAIAIHDSDDDGISGEGSDCKAIAIHDSDGDGISGEGSDCKAIAIHDSDDDGISGEGSDCKAIAIHDSDDDGSGGELNGTDDRNNEESLGDIDNLFAEILNLQEWRNDDSSSLLHAFNEPLITLANAMVDLIASDDDDDDSNHGGSGDSRGIDRSDIDSRVNRIHDSNDNDGGGGFNHDLDNSANDISHETNGETLSCKEDFIESYPLYKNARKNDGGSDDEIPNDAANSFKNLDVASSMEDATRNCFSQDPDSSQHDHDDDNSHLSADKMEEEFCKVDNLNPVTLEQINLTLLPSDNIGTNSSDEEPNHTEKENILFKNKLDGSAHESFGGFKTSYIGEGYYKDLNNTNSESSSSIYEEGVRNIAPIREDYPNKEPEKMVSESYKNLDNTNSKSSSSPITETQKFPYIAEFSAKASQPTILRQTYKPRLRSLDITNIYFHSKALGVACLKLFSAVNRTLESFAVSWSELDDDTLVSVVSNQPGLRSLTLTDCEKLTNQSLLSLPVHCSVLENIDLKGVPFITDLGVTPMLDAPCLKTLSLAEASVTDRSMFAIAKKCGEKLRDLDLSWCEDLTDSGICAMAESCSGLRSLALRQCSASIVTMETLSIYPQLITSLNIAGVKDLTDQAVVAVAKNMPNLTFVDLSWNSGVTSIGVSGLLFHCGRLAEALLSGLKVLTSKPFLGIIGDLPRWRTLQEIMLRRKLKSKQSGESMESCFKPCNMETAKCIGDDLPFRSTSYSPALRNLVLEYSDKVNDDHLSQIVAVCRGTLNIRDYYGQTIEPMWIFL